MKFQQTYFAVDFGSRKLYVTSHARNFKRLRHTEIRLA